MSKILRLGELTKLIAECYYSKLEKRDEQRMERREYIYASELGSGFADRFLSMSPEPWTNPPNPRAIMKANAGKVWEFVVKIIYARCGVLKSTQDRVWGQYPGLIGTSGKLDFSLDGKIDFDKGAKTAKELDIPDFFDQFVDEFRELVDLNREVEPCFHELKSSGSIMFEKYVNTRKPAIHHAKQAQHYSEWTKKPGVLTYICRDDARILHFIIEPGGKYFEPMKADLSYFTDYFYRNERPPIEPLCLYDPERNRFSKNWRIEYSRYLTLLYNYDNPEKYREEWESKCNRWNRVLKIIEGGKKMHDLTADNRAALKEMEPFFNYKEN